MAVVGLFNTFIDVITLSAIVYISEPSWTLACVTTNSIGTCCTSVTLVSSLVTFVNINTFSIFEFKSSVTNACWGIIFFDASSAATAVMIFTVVDIVTVDTISREPGLTFTCETTNGVGAVGILVTVVGVSTTFVNIDTFSIFEFKSSITNACWCIILFNAIATLSTVNILAVINIVAIHSITGESSFTFAGETTNGVSAVGIFMTVISIFVTFIDINTFSILEFETGIADTCWCIILFDAVSTLSAVVVFAVVNIVTVYAITIETIFTFAGETTVGIGANSIFMTVIGTFIALIDVFALATSCDFETCITFTFEGTVRVNAFLFAVLAGSEVKAFIFVCFFSINPPETFTLVTDI